MRLKIRGRVAADTAYIPVFRRISPCLTCARNVVRRALTFIKSYPTLKPIHRGAAEQIGQHLHFAVTRHHTTLEHGHMMVAAKLFEVVQGTQMDVRGVVPLSLIHISE